MRGGVAVRLRVAVVCGDVVLRCCLMDGQYILREEGVLDCKPRSWRGHDIGSYRF